jgi:hypothetical protein
MPKSALKLRELLRRLQPFGVVPVEDRGKGSEIILLQPQTPGSVKEPQFPIKNHGMGTEIITPAGKHVNLNDDVKGPNPLAELVEAITTVHDIFLYLSTGAIVFR